MRPKLEFNVGDWLTTSVAWFLLFTLLMCLYLRVTTSYGTWQAGFAVYCCIAAITGFYRLCDAARKLQKAQSSE